MKLLESIYFHVYNVYYKDGNYTNDIPHLTAFGIVGCSLSFIFAFIVSFINYLNDKSRLSFEIIVGAIILGLLFFFFLFLFQNKYKRIYENIKGSKMDNWFMKLLSWLIIIAGFATVGLYAYIFNQPVK